MYKKVLYFVSGAIFATILNLGIGFADDGFYKLTKVDYPIFVDGKLTSFDMPVLNYNGSTYLPLRKMGEAINADITWNDFIKGIYIKPKVKEIIKEVPKEVIKEVPKSTLNIIPQPLDFKYKEYLNDPFVCRLLNYSSAVDNSDMELVKVVKELPNDNLLVENYYGTEYVLEAKGYLSYTAFREGDYYVGKIESFSSIIIDSSGEVEEFYTE